MKLNVINTTGKNTTITVSDEIFASTINGPLMAQAVRVFLSNQRQGTSKVKTRAEVDRTKKKWFKQKGTGNARHGARSANIFVGGGVAHGPKGIVDWTLKLSKQMKRKALVSALSSQIENTVVTTVLDDIKPKTKDAVAYLSKLAPDNTRILVIVEKAPENLVRSTSNLDYVLITSAHRLNIHEILLADKIIMNKDAVKALEARLLGTSVSKTPEKQENAEVAEVETIEEAAPAVEKEVKPKKAAAKKKAVKKE